MEFYLLFGILFVISCIVFIRFWIIFPGRSRDKPTIGKKGKQKKCMIVLGSGGHTAEMFRILRGLNCRNYFPRVYIKAEDDKISTDHCNRFESSIDKFVHSDSPFSVLNIPRARQVGQSYFTSIFTTLNALKKCISLVWNENPDLVRFYCFSIYFFIIIFLILFYLKRFYVMDQVLVFLFVYQHI